MRTVKLDEVAAPATRRAGSAVELPVYSVTKHSGFVPSGEYFKKKVYGKDLSSYKRVRAEEFAYATIHLDEGSLGVAPVECLISPMYTVFKTNTDLVDSKFLVRLLKSPWALAQYEHLGQGSVHRRRSISWQALSRLQIPFPPLDEQRRIAGILDQADAIRTKRRASLALIEELASAVFFEVMNGPSQVRSLRDCGVDFISGKNVVGGAGDTHARNRVIKVSSVSRGRFIPAESKVMPASYDPPETHRINPGDVLFGRASGTLSLLGCTVIARDVPANYFIPDKVWKMKVADSAPVSQIFVHHYLKSPTARQYIELHASGAAGVKNISKKSMLDMPVQVPSALIQQEFAARVEQINAQRALVERALEKDEELFASLQSRAFSGEL